MSRLSRNKGRRFELEAAELFRAIWPAADNNIGQWRGGAKRSGADILHVPFHVECKVGSRPDILSAMRQAVQDAKATELPPIVVSKRDREGILVTMQWETFRDLVKPPECPPDESAERILALERRVAWLQRTHDEDERLNVPLRRAGASVFTIGPLRVAA